MLSQPELKDRTCENCARDDMQRTCRFAKIDYNYYGSSVGLNAGPHIISFGYRCAGMVRGAEYPAMPPILFGKVHKPAPIDGATEIPDKWIWKK